MTISKYGAYLAVAALVASLIYAFSATSTAAPSGAEGKDVVVLTSKNTLVLNQVVDGESVSDVLEKARELDKGARGNRFVLMAKHALRGKPAPQPIYLFLNTPGGSIQSGLELIEGLNGLRRPVNSVTAFAASMGLQIAQGLNGERLIVSHGIMMSHRGAGEFGGQFGGLEPSQASNRYRIMAQQLKEMDERTVSRTKGKQTLESYQKAYNQELWVTGQEAVAQGYADKMVGLRCDESLNGVTTHSVDFMGATIEYDLDNCPINTSPHNVRLSLPTNHGTMTTIKFREAKGSFGASCLQEAVIDSTRICALDTTLTYEKLEQVVNKFMNTFENNRNNVVPMTW